MYGNISRMVHLFENITLGIIFPIALVIMVISLIVFGIEQARMDSKYININHPESIECVIWKFASFINSCALFTVGGIMIINVILVLIFK